MAAPYGRRVLLLALLLTCDRAWGALAGPAPEQGALEVLIRVQVFDSSDLSPLDNAAVQVFGNQSTLVSSGADGDGLLTVTFRYQLGTSVIVAASKMGYVSNSVPWRANRIPLYSSVSLYLLPQRPATLILYDDVVQLLSGSPGARHQPRVQLQRKAVHLPSDSSYSELWAVLTAARSQYEIGAFPYMLGRDTNGTGGNGSWTDMSPVAAVSAHLVAHNGSAVRVTEPVHVSVPLPSDSPVKAATSVPVWRFDDATGLWLRSGTGYIRQEGTLFICSFVAQQLGDWAAALPSGSGVSLGTSGLRDISSYHTIFLLTILGSMALLVLILLCLLLYYCRRRCLKPRQHRKMHVPSTMDSSRRDQGTSMSRLNLISGGHADTASSKDDKNALKCDLSSSQEFFGRDAAHKLQHSKGSGDGRPWRGESFPMKVTHSTEMGADPPLLPSDYARSCGSVEDKSGDGRRRHNANENQGYSSDPPSSPPSAKRSQNPKPDGKPPEYSDPVARPTSLNTQPSQFIFCSSIDQMKENMYRSMVPTLVIPAHYMRLSSDFSGADPAAEPQHKADKDEVPGGRLSTPQPQQQPPTVSPPGEDPEGRGWAPNPSSGPVRIPVLFDNSTMAQMNGELQALTEKKLRELGVRQHPRAWFISLDGRSNSHVRHSYVDLGEEFGLDSMADVRKGKPASQRRAKGDKGGGGGKGHGGKAYAKLSYLEDMESGGGGEGPATMCSPEDNSLTPLLDEEPEPRGASATRRGRSRVSSGNRRDSATSLEDENEADDKDDEGENKKSPWQRREERPLMVFNVKK
ncbi:protein FAM171A2-like [Scleropages formosus]|uniref:Family with sequence similarity 171 member A2 n=1 Tax=Scleropages formosus TaxID=113540 RepID=A0A8C9W7Q0_SCLFO|nr:protein FAM171A2-like [Scleropages formosus]